MTIILKNKETLICGEFRFKCCIGKKGKSKNKIEGDLKTPKGNFNLDKLYFRKDKNSKPLTKLKCVPITKEMGWCNDVRNKNKWYQYICILILRFFNINY